MARNLTKQQIKRRNKWKRRKVKEIVDLAKRNYYKHRYHQVVGKYSLLKGLKETSRIFEVKRHFCDYWRKNIGQLKSFIQN